MGGNLGHQSRPVVYLVPGLGRSAAVWEKVQKVLEGRRIQSIVWSSPGAGTAEGRLRAAAEIADELASACEEMSALGRRVLIATHSFGVVMGTLAARELQSSLYGLVLTNGSLLTSERLINRPVSPTWMTPYGLKFGLFLLGISSPLAELRIGSIEQNVLLRMGIVGRLRRLSGEDWETILRFGHCYKAAELVWKTRPFYLEEISGEVRCPTIVLDGGSDPLCRASDHEDLCSALPSLIRASRPRGVGHVMPIEAPEDVANAISELAGV